MVVLTIIYYCLAYGYVILLRLLISNSLIQTHYNRFIQINFFNDQMFDSNRRNAKIKYLYPAQGLRHARPKALRELS